MLNDRELEENHILECISENKLKMEQLHRDFKPGAKIRYIVDSDKTKKQRFNLSPCYYVIDSVDNFKAAIIAKDGSSKTVPLFRIVKLKEKETKVPFAETIEGSIRGIIEKIVDYNPKSKKSYS